VDPATIIGLVLGIGSAIFGMIMAGSGTGLYINGVAFVIVVLGSLGPVVLSVPFSRFRTIPYLLALTFRKSKVNETETIDTLVSFAETARREGILALEDRLPDLDDAFLRAGVQLVVDGTDPDSIRTILYTETDKTEQRHIEGSAMFAFWGTMAPAFGLLGTIIGLVAMLANVSDPSSITKGMAVALITTLYGTITANCFLLPFGRKLEDLTRREIRAKEIVIEGVLSIQAGDNPRIVREKLLSFLPESERAKVNLPSTTPGIVQD